MLRAPADYFVHDDGGPKFYTVVVKKNGKWEDVELTMPARRLYGEALIAAIKAADFSGHKNPIRIAANGEIIYVVEFTEEGRAEFALGERGWTLRLHVDDFLWEDCGPCDPPNSVR